MSRRVKDNRHKHQCSGLAFGNPFRKSNFISFFNNKFCKIICCWLSYFRNPHGNMERIKNYWYIYETTLCFHVPLRNTYFVLNMITCRLTRNVIGKVWRTFFLNTVLCYRHTVFLHPFVIKYCSVFKVQDWL